MAEPSEGSIGLTIDESTPTWPEPQRTRPGAPNVLYWVIDDTGFGQLSPYGGLIQMPNLQRLVDNGLLYTNFHTTALCSPTRACLLTGRNHHSNHMGNIPEISTGYPGYDARIPFENGLLSEVLAPLGYATYALGKWHLTPQEEMHLADSREHWPLGRGFQRFYGFLPAETNQWYPDLVYDNHAVDPPKTPEEGYHLSEDLSDRAIEFLKDLRAVQPSKPFFLYLAYGANHAPHHAPKEWADKYKGTFDMGWDQYREMVHRRQLEMGILPPGTELSPRDPEVPEWASLSADQKRLYARMMEVYAGYSSHMDHQFGRVLDFLQELGELDNTLIVFVSDNGASAEGGVSGSVNEGIFFNMVPEDLQRNLAQLEELGGPRTYNHYPWGWTWAGNTPFRRWKRETYRGGISDPCVVAWPKGIAAKGEKRSQYVHAIDVVPTVLEVAEAKPPAFIKGVEQAPIEGISFAYTFAQAGAKERHMTQYYEMFAHRSIYHDGWKAVCPWPYNTVLTAAELQRLEREGWELSHVAEDASESHDVAAQYPDKLREMVARWWTEAGKYHVLPLDGRMQLRALDPRPQIDVPRQQYVYYPGCAGIAAEAGVRVLNSAHTIRTEVVIPGEGAEGVLLAEGSRFGGYTFFVKDSKLTYVHNYVGIAQYAVVADAPVPTGEHTFTYSFTPTGQPDFAQGKGTPGKGQLYIDGKLVGEGNIPVTTPIAFGIGGNVLSVGRDDGTSASDAYEPPFAFTGTLKRVVVDVSGQPRPQQRVEEARVAIARH